MVRTLFLVLAILAAAVIPTPADGGSEGHGSRGHHHHRHHHHRHHHGHHHFHHVGGFVVYDPFLFYPYPYYYPDPISSPLVVVEPSPVVHQPPAPAVQREVVYPNGRYVLYGDGVNKPCQWVWIPAAPPAPPQLE